MLIKDSGNIYKISIAFQVVGTQRLSNSKLRKRKIISSFQSYKEKEKTEFLSFYLTLYTTMLKSKEFIIRQAFYNQPVF